MSELNDFALKVASLLDQMAASVPETGSVPGAPFHLTLLEMGKIARYKHEQSKIEKRAEPLSMLLAGLGGAGLGAGAYKALKGLPGYLNRSAMSQLTGPGGLGAGELAQKALMGIDEVAAAKLLKSNPALQGAHKAGLAEAGTAAQAALPGQLAEAVHPYQMGALGLGGLALGQYSAKPSQNQSNLPQIVRYG